jgi:tetratricopeptide (TPR) repeat protein
VFYRLGSYKEAIEMYNEAIGRSNDSSSAYTNLGNAYYKLEKIEDAIDAWKKALALDPANEKARRNLKRFHAEVK